MAKKNKKSRAKTFYLPAPPPPPPPPPPPDTDTGQPQQTPAIPVPPSQNLLPHLKRLRLGFTADPVSVKTWGPSTRICKPQAPKPIIKDGYLVQPALKKKLNVVQANSGVGGLVVGEEAGLNANPPNLDIIAASMSCAQVENTFQVTLEGREESYTVEMKEVLEGGVMRKYWVTTYTSETWQTQKPLAEGERSDSKDDSDDDSDDESTESESSEDDSDDASDDESSEGQ
jgi:hypothetical protein